MYLILDMSLPPKYPKARSGCAEQTSSKGESSILRHADSRYFKQEALTKDAITADGWFKTGDIGQWESDGTLSIIDRIKNLVKLQNGEYIALDRLESIYKACGMYLVNVRADDRCRHVHLYMRTALRRQANCSDLSREQASVNGADSSTKAICDIS